MAEPANRRTVLIVSMDSPARERFRVVLKSAGFTVLVAASGPAALDHIERDRPDAMVLDLDMSGTGAVELIEGLARDRGTRDLPVVVMTGTYWRLCVTPHATLAKPVTPDELLRVVTAAVRQQSP